MSPIIAQVIFARAADIFALSPPEEDHWNPPQIKKIKVTITPNIKKSVIAFESTFCTVPNPPEGSSVGGLIVLPPGSVNAK